MQSKNGLANIFRIENIYRITSTFRILNKIISAIVLLIFSTTVCAKLTNSKITELNEIQNLKAIEDTSKPLLRLPIEAKWTPAPDKTLPKGAEMFVLEGNPSFPAPYIIRLKLPPNFKVPAHWNLSDEHLTVISGSIHLGIGDKLEEKKGKLLPVGSYARIPARMHHFAWTGDEETIVQLSGIGPWGLNYIEPLEGENWESVQEIELQP